MTSNTPYLLALHSIPGLGPIRLKAVVDYFQDPQLAWNADQKELIKIGLPQNVVQVLVETRRKLNPEEYAQKISQSGIKWLTIFDEAYPKLLKEIAGSPIVFYYQGEILPGDQKAVAIVGTRKVTGYGKLITEKFARELSEAGVTVVSGLARGVDSVAHQAVVESGGRTLAVLGGGLNNIFPPENIRLAQKIAQGHGAVISEFAPNEPSLPGNFPARNRIISGLSLGVLVTEAAEDSGSLITAKAALDQGREVFAIPGPITSDLSKGPSFLIKQGAKLVTATEEILEELGINKGHGSKVLSQESLKLDETEKKILECLENENKHVDEICRELKIPSSVVSAALIKMEINGLIENLGGGNYVKIF
jgi:DNA processing protein